MISSQFANRLNQLEHERFRLTSRAAGYRLQAFDTIEILAPHAARIDMAVAVLRFARKHWALTGALVGMASLALRRRIGMLGLAQLALKLGGRFLAR